MNTYASDTYIEREEKMKRGEEMEKVYLSEIRSAIEELTTVKVEKEISTVSFLRLSNQLLLVLDKIGPTMAVLRNDVQKNIERLEEIYVLDPSMYSNLVEILNKEVEEGSTRKPQSCSKAIVWLSSVELLKVLVKDSELSIEQAVEEAYKSTLKPWHGWISSAAYKLALKLIPEREIFITLLMGQGQDYEALKGDILKLVTLLQPLLDEINALLMAFKLDRLKAN